MLDPRLLEQCPPILIMTRKPVTVLCGGCFNTIHEGHVRFLSRAKALGDRLVVVVANDVHDKKPYARPQAVRARSVRALKIADKVVVGGKRGFLSSVCKAMPKLIALGYDQTLPADVAKKLGDMNIEVRRLKRYKNASTRSLSRRT